MFYSILCRILLRLRHSKKSNFFSSSSSSFISYKRSFDQKRTFLDVLIENVFSTEKDVDIKRSGNGEPPCLAWNRITSAIFKPIVAIKMVAFSANRKQPLMSHHYFFRTIWFAIKMFHLNIEIIAPQMILKNFLKNFSPKNSSAALKTQLLCACSLRSAMTSFQFPSHAHAPRVDQKAGFEVTRFHFLTRASMHACVVIIKTQIIKIRCIREQILKFD